MYENKDLAIAIAKRFLERLDYEVIDSADSAEWPYGFDILAKDGDDLVFVYVEANAREDGALPEGALDRATAESHAIQWFEQQEDARECAFRFDTVDLLVMGTDRALLRHHINVLSDAGREEEA